MKKPMIALLIAALAAAGWYAYQQQNQSALPEGLVASNGRLELERLDVATLYPGRVERVLVAEGDSVTAGQVLAELSSAQSSSQLAAAQASVQQAEAAAQQVRETVARADAEISAQRQQLRVAQMELDNTRRLYADQLVSAAEVQRREAARDGAQAALKAAQAARAEARAAVGQAQARVGQAQAQSQAAESANHDMQIRAPQAGRVEYRLAEPGNVLGAGGKVMSLLDPDDASMAIFLPNAQMARLKVGDEARIVLDGIDAVFPATIRHIASEAQFTPKAVETQTERAKLMFRVKLGIPADTARQYHGLLKGGLTGNGYVRLNGQTDWPAELAVKLPQ